MDTPTLLGTALALAMDAFAVAAAVSAAASRLTLRQVFRLTWHFGLFQALMPIAGWWGGVEVARILASIDHWLAFGVLAFLGTKMIWDSFQPLAERAQGDPTRGWNLIALSLATSIDALAVGLSLGLLGVSIWLPAAVIGLVAALLTLAGTLAGRRAGASLGAWAGRLAGVVLLLIGARVLVGHLAAGI